MFQSAHLHSVFLTSRLLVCSCCLSNVPRVLLAVSSKRNHQAVCPAVHPLLPGTGYFPRCGRQEDDLPGGWNFAPRPGSCDQPLRRPGSAGRFTSRPASGLLSSATRPTGLAYASEAKTCGLAPVSPWALHRGAQRKINLNSIRSIERKYTLQNKHFPFC